jgi:hypothetical protein
MFAAPLFAGTLFALAAGLMWGLVFVGPLLLPQYPPALHTFGWIVRACAGSAWPTGSRR